jgi:3-isopropylmalate dehydrogenase
MLRYTLNQGEAADAIEAAVSVVLDQGLRTADISSNGNQTVDTKTMGDAVVSALIKG